MKNDVVRWNAVENPTDKTYNTNNTNKNTNNNNNNNNNNNSNALLTRRHVAQNERTLPTATVALTPTPTPTPTPTSSPSSTATAADDDHLKSTCDNLINKRINCLVNLKRNHKTKKVCDASFTSSNSSSSSSATTQFAGHSDGRRQERQHSHYYRNVGHFLLISLKFSVVVFLCNFRNFGCVLANDSTVSNSRSSSSSREAPSSIVGYPYELDYEDNKLESSGTNDGHYTHTWAVHIPNGDSGLADEVARDHGFVNLGKIFDDHYHFAHHKISKRSLTPASSHQLRLDVDDRVHWAKQQKAKSRRKRDFIRMRPSRTSSSRALSLVDAVPFNDPKWSQMWYLNRGGGLDMNVIPAWKSGITGKGIVVTILDDGLESDHPDIEHNYDPKASYDVNSHDEDPMPHYDLTDSNRHGTRCAGEVAATANNSICAVGIAFGASVGGVRMLDGDVTDAVEARSLSLNPQHIDIYSASWGPDDDGKTVDGPGELASRAFIEGVTKGRNGKGSIFIWASGNGGRELDNCNCDGYTNSIWTLSISSATEEGHVPWYSEKCSSTLATTYSSGGQSEKQVVTTDLHHSCTVSHTGTSASAPLAAGIAALVLESNQNLTWRDLQHIVVRTAKPANLKDPTWSKNGVGRRISHSFGYGLMDAAAMVKVARTWKTVPEQQRCEINAPHVDKVIPPKSYITLQLTVRHCQSVNYLEHVQAKITLTSQRRGDIQLYLTSPAGTKVTLLTSRIHDVSRSGFNQWPFMSVHTWGESPHGNWQLEIHNEGRYMAQITQWDLIFYGTEPPAQPDDRSAQNAGQFGLFGNDMEHNDIEYDASGQWRNMQQVGESNIRSNDRTNTSCLKATVDQKCLACAPPTYLFNSSCLALCPTHTYAITNHVPSHRDDEANDNKIPNSEPGEELQSTDRRRRLIDDMTTTTTTTTRSCGICDFTCLRCYGPLNSQCSSCVPGSQLRKLPLTNETYCYGFAERSSGNSQDGGTGDGNSGEGNKLQSDIILYILIMITFAIVGGIVVLMVYKGRLPCSRGVASGLSGETTVRYSYDRVALLPDDKDSGDLDVDDEAEVEVYSAKPSNAVPADTEKPTKLSPTTVINFVDDFSDSEDELMFNKTSNA